MTTVFSFQERTVKLKRRKDTGLGISIKGGSEHKLPIMISRIFPRQAADETGQLFVGDAIIKGTGGFKKISRCRITLFLRGQAKTLFIDFKALIFSEIESS